MARKIPATIITGFLGAGKTSLIRSLIEQADGRRLAFIINEFGDLGIDRDIVRGCGLEACDEDSIKELANGCLCCTVADDFLPTMESLIDRPNPPDHIIIETSGLALPKPLVQAFNWPSMKARVTVDGVITVIDAPAVAAGRFADDPEAVAAQRAADLSLDHENPLEEVFTDQLACADLVVINKTDGLTPAETISVTDDLAKRLRPGVKAIAAVRGKLPIAILLGLSAAAEDDLAQRPSVHDAEEEHDHEDFESFVLPFGQIEDTAPLIARLGRAAEEHDILRIKGFVAVEGAARRCVIQGVGTRFERYFDRPWEAGEKASSALVVIGKRGLDREAITGTIMGTPA
jgi:cobalamin biosynthesis protein CobW